MCSPPVAFRCYYLEDLRDDRHNKWVFEGRLEVMFASVVY